MPGKRFSNPWNFPILGKNPRQSPRDRKGITRTLLRLSFVGAAWFRAVGSTSLFAGCLVGTAWFCAVWATCLFLAGPLALLRTSGFAPVLLAARRSSSATPAFQRGFRSALGGLRAESDIESAAREEKG